MYPALSSGVVGTITDGSGSRGRAKSSPVKNWLDTFPGRRYSPAVSRPRTVRTPPLCS